ncbi:MAG TPA: sigma-70 family RNA polymerase sigma factor [Polyangiaceae bacterium]
MSIESYEHDSLAEPVGFSAIHAPVRERLNEGAAWGPERLVAQLVSQHSRYVWCLLRRLGVRVANLDDATQQVFIVAARRLEDVPVGRERAFLCGTAVRIASNFRKSDWSYGARHSEASLEDIQCCLPNSESLMEQMQARQLLDAVLDSLSDDLRTVFVLSEIEGLTAPEAAAILDVPVGTVSSRLRRAREQFRAQAARLRDALLAGEAL